MQDDHASRQDDWLPAGAPPLYSQDGAGYGAIVHAHYFIGGNDWLVTEYDPEQRVGFGWACLNGDRQNAELGYVPMDELASIKVPLVLGSIRVPDAVTVERDEGWPEGLTLTEAIAELDRRQGR